MQLHLAVTEWNDAAFQGVIENPQNRRDVISFRPLFTAEEMHSAMVKANSLSTKFDAPNRDEIDRMLLDE